MKYVYPAIFKEEENGKYSNAILQKEIETCKLLQIKCRKPVILFLKST